MAGSVTHLVADSPALTRNLSTLLRVENVKTYFPVRRRGGERGQVVKAVDGVSLQLRRGESLALVGESGCGKTTLARTILRLTPATSGNVEFNGQDVFAAGRRELKGLRRQMQIVFQDPLGTLDPRLRVGRSIAIPLQQHGVGDTDQRRTRVLEVLDRVGLEAEFAERYPFQCSGGQLQRIGIARALALKPALLVCDEPTSSLDVSVQAEILNLLNELRSEMNLALLFITHDLPVARYMANRIAVMYLGRIVEMSGVQSVFDSPTHPYTQALLSSIPPPTPGLFNPIVLESEVPSPLAPPPGCHFNTRCPSADERCVTDDPSLELVGPNHWAACWRWEDIHRQRGGDAGRSGPGHPNTESDKEGLPS